LGAKEGKVGGKSRNIHQHTAGIRLELLQFAVTWSDARERVIRPVAKSDVGK
jgi:hypothetical protein